MSRCCNEDLLEFDLGVNWPRPRLFESRTSPDAPAAHLGLARCLVAENDPAAAEPHYELVIIENPANYQRVINVLTEYVLVLQKDNNLGKSIKYFNETLHFSVSPNALNHMATFPADFREDGSGYNARLMTSLVHIMRALNSDWNEPKRILDEGESAIEAETQTPTPAAAAGN